jgi:hypothetical protein
MTRDLPSLAALGLALPRVPVWVGAPRTRSSRRSRSPSPPPPLRSPSPSPSRGAADSPFTTWMPPPSSPHAPCPDNPALVVRTSGIPNAGDGLFTTVDIPEMTIIAEYYGPVATDLDVIASRNQSTYAGKLTTPARPLDGLPLQGPWITTVLGDVDNCIATKANMRPDPAANKAVLVSAYNFYGVLDERYLDERYASRPSGGRMYACDRIYVLAIHPIAAGEEIFLYYGDSYGELA